MKTVTDTFTIHTKGGSEVLDITGQVASMLKHHSVSEGTALVFVQGSTASVTTTEFEPGLCWDIPEALETIAPRDARYHHDDTWHDGNGHSHIRAAFLGPSLSIPFAGGKLLLGTWQQIVLIDHDNRPRQRSIIVQLMGE